MSTLTQRERDDLRKMIHSEGDVGGAWLRKLLDALDSKDATIVSLKKERDEAQNALSDYLKLKSAP